MLMGPRVRALRIFISVKFCLTFVNFIYSTCNVHSREIELIYIFRFGGPAPSCQCPGPPKRGALGGGPALVHP
jgi:hypothetical protein